MAHTSDTLLDKPLPRRQDRRWLRRALSMVTLAVTLVVMVDALFGERGFAEMLRARRAYADSRASLAALRQKNAGLREQARRLMEDPSAIEAVARRELGLIREGEVVFVLKPVR